MPKGKLLFGQIGKSRQTQQPIQRDLPQNDYPLQVFQRLHLLLQPRQAIEDFFPGGFVGRRRAATYRRDEDISQYQSICSCACFWLAGKPCPKESWIEKISRTVPREHPPGAVGSVRARCQTQNQNPGVWVTKSRHWLTPVILITVSLALDTRDFFPPRHQSRAFPANYQFLLNLFK